MITNKPTRASQSQSDLTKVKSQASSVKPKVALKPWTPPSYLDNLMKEQDSRMPINIDKQSRTFGGKR
jgi:hypothetical protein